MSILRLNRIQRAFARRGLDTDVDNGINSLHRMVIENLKEDIFSDTGDLRGFVLRVEPSLERPPSKSWHADLFSVDESKQHSSIFGVKVRIPEVHSYLPNPIRLLSEKAEYDPSQIDRVIDMHPTFICKDYNLANDLPSIGDIVYVDFVDKKNWREGIYKGKVFDKPTGISTYSPSDAFDRYFDDPRNIPGCTPPAPGNTKGAEPAAADHIPEFCEPAPYASTTDVCKTDPNCGWYKGKPIKGFAKLLIGKGNERMLPETRKAFDELNEIAIKEGLKPFGITVAFRSYAYQQELVDRYAAGDPKVYTPSQPGKSNHHVGTAIDVKLATGTVRRNQIEFLRKYAKEAGFRWAGEGDPVHIELLDTASVVRQAKAKIKKQEAEQIAGGLGVRRQPGEF